MRVFFWIIFIVTVSLSFLSCSKSLEGDNLALDSCKEIRTDTSMQYVPVDSSAYVEESDVGITNVQLFEKCLSIDFSYTGGCETHDFDLVWNERFYSFSPDPISEDEPAPLKAVLWFVHGNKNDRCDALLNETILFDLTPIQSDMLTDSTKVWLEVFGVPELIGL